MKKRESSWSASVSGRFLCWRNLEFIYREKGFFYRGAYRFLPFNHFFVFILTSFGCWYFFCIFQYLEFTSRAESLIYLLTQPFNPIKLSWNFFFKPKPLGKWKVNQAILRRILIQLFVTPRFARLKIFFFHFHGEVLRIYLVLLFPRHLFHPLLNLQIK